MVAEIVKNLQVSHLLDYGCGHNLSLFKALGPKLKALGLPYKVTLQAYDPGVPQLAAPPVPAQMVTCLDVLEHIEPECLEAVLDDLQRCTKAVLFATIASGPAVKTLPDGRNAHLIQQPIKWWLPKFWDRFELQHVMVDGVVHRHGGGADGGFIIIAYAKPAAELATP
jgi:hypothetical protein